MPSNPRPSFEFRNAVAPRYIEPLFSRLVAGEWYNSDTLKQILRASGLNIEGSNTVSYSTSVWALCGLGEVRIITSGRSQVKLFRLTELGQQILEAYSTNQALFYDLMHFIFYSAWHRSYSLKRARFWVYARVCDALWDEAPAAMDSNALTNRLQIESQRAFPDQIPSFPERSVRAVFPWLGALTPPFLVKCGTKSQLCSTHRSYCTPQLFHLATDLFYAGEGLAYGTSVALDDRHIEAISRVCLLDSARFWDMAELTRSAVQGFAIRRGQWGVSVVLESPPDWIDLPDFASDPAEPENTAEDDSVVAER